ALDGDGAFSPERAGGVPSGALIKLCFSGQYTEKEIYKKFVGAGGFNAYCNTNDMRDVEKMVQGGDEKAAEIREAFIMQVAKDIGSMACVLKGKIDQIIITGGIAYDKAVVAGLKERAGFISPITVYPGEDELLALAQGALRVMNGEEKAMIY
nr:butyrate kinase [Lachnospiraceae bacterium]